MGTTGNNHFSEINAPSSVAAVIEAPSVTNNVWKERSLFLLNFLKNPLRNASVIPSSKAAGRAILTGLDWSKINTVVELGPGNGTFTAKILSRCTPGTNVILIELEESYVQLLRGKFGNKVTVVHDSAHRMNEILEELNLSQADLIISSLPFLQKQISRQIFTAILEQTKLGAAYRFFTYMPPVMKWFYQGMPLHKVKFVLGNIPPMWIYGIN
jgi:phospholipid N-methyltransferase